MASKRKRKMEQKAIKELDSKMEARRAAFNDNLWKYGLPCLLYTSDAADE